MESEGLVLVPHCWLIRGDSSVAPPPGDGAFGVGSSIAGEAPANMFKRNVMPGFGFGKVAAP